MAWSVFTWKIRRIFQSQFLFGEVRALTRHSSYTSTLCLVAQSTTQNNSQNLTDLQIPPSNKLEKLKGHLKDFYSIRINNQWRIIFKWNSGNADRVEIIDYH